jgi:hypothetical protein
MTDRPRYEHDATKGETRYPPEEGEQYGGRRGERDPHGRLNTPVSEIEQQAEQEGAAQGGPVNDVRGMGSAQDGQGNPELPEGSRGDREERNPGQTTPRGVEDAEAEAMRRAQEATGVPLVDDRST